MKGQTFINDKDIWVHFSARLIDNSFDSLEDHAAMKEYVSNDMRSQHGIQLIVSNPRVKSRNVTLTFDINCDSADNYRTKRRALERELTQGFIELKVIPLKTIYKLVVTEDSTFNLSSNVGLSDGKLVVRLLEPNPKDRESTLRTAYILSTDGKALVSVVNKILTRNIK